MNSLHECIPGIVWDNHACMPLTGTGLQISDLRRCHEAGIDVLSINVASGAQSAANALGILSAFRASIRAYPDEFTVIASPRDAIAAHAAGKLGVCFDIEGLTVLDLNLDMVERYRSLGVRWMLPVYNERNALGGGCLDQEDLGLTHFGRQVVAEMNRVGIVVCGSHAGDRTARELIDASSQPVIFSHSNPRSVWSSPRNVPDDVMLACARRGGVVGLNGIGAFLGANDTRIDTFARHIEYALELIGEDHVGIGLDYCFEHNDDMRDFMGSYPTLFPHTHGYAKDGMKMIAPWQLPQVADTLVKRGVAQSVLSKLFGGNHLRIATSVWQLSS